MSGPERKAPDDQLLEDFLEGRSPTSRAWREAMRGESAPPELDDAVLGMAREEIRAAATRPPSRDRFRDRRWPFALAAVLVLSFSTLLTIVQDPVAHKDAMMVPQDVAPSGTVVLPETSVPAAATVPAERRAMAIEAAPKPTPAPRKAEAATAKPLAPAAPAESQADVMSQSGAGAAPEAESLAAPAPPPPAPAAAPVIQEQREQAAPQAQMRAAPEAEMRRRAASSSDFLGAAKLKREEAGPVIAAAQLDRIRRMLAEGHEDEAREALEAWRKQWPEQEVPADLLRLLD